MGKRKPLVIASSVIIALASLILAFAPTWIGGLAGAVVLGIGFGAYLAVDFALITQVLPTGMDRGRDLGVINIANSLPQVIAPLIASPFVLYWGGYVSLYVAAAVIGLMGAVFVVKIKSVDLGLEHRVHDVPAAADNRLALPCETVDAPAAEARRVGEVHRQLTVRADAVNVVVAIAIEVTGDPKTTQHFPAPANDSVVAAGMTVLIEQAVAWRGPNL